jgi:hypothetical protein
METTLTCSTGTSCRQLAWARNIGCGDNIVWGSTVDYNLTTWHLRRQPAPNGSVDYINIPWDENILRGDVVRWAGDLVQPLGNVVRGEHNVWAIPLRKLGAVQEAQLRQALLCQEQYIDQTVWSIVESGL